MSNTMDQIHEVIWLAPWCDGCASHAYGSDGRTWCQDNVYDPCEECGREPVKYVLAGTQQPARFDGEQALAEFEAKHPRPNWLQGDNETIREWREGDPMPAAKK